ncbi:MAG: hypothetical protein KDB57_04175 [Solirubrobacterales bacterium]|nr:hypothetical protein [Solirubrobacterales bacterium]
MKKPLVIAATLAVVLSLGLAACGGDDSSEETLSNSELIAQADQICTDYNEQLDTMNEEAALDENSSRQEIATYISDDLVPLYQEQVDELRSLNPNEEDAAAYNDIVDTLESELQVVEDDPEAAIDAEDPFAGATAKAQDFGLEVCGSN